MRKHFTFLIIYLFSQTVHAQIIVSGTVLDKSKINYVEGAKVISTGGKVSVTDSMGRYIISVQKGDSIYFMYNAKPTQRFAVNAITNFSQFDISLLVPVKGKYTVLKEVIVYTKSYKQHSAENREDYKDVFSYHKPRISTSIAPGGGVGMDADELINMFRFRRNKRLKKFQKRLEDEEQEKYVTNRFNKISVRRITQLQGTALDTFLVWYRPSYEFASNASEIIFTQYVLNASYQYRKITGRAEAKKEESNAVSTH